VDTAACAHLVVNPTLGVMGAGLGELVWLAGRRTLFSSGGRPCDVPTRLAEVRTPVRLSDIDRRSETLSWARAHASASVLADLAHAYLRPADGTSVDRLLRSGSWSGGDEPDGETKKPP
jgi:hypothetical protein